MAVKKTNAAASEPKKIESLFSKEQLLAAERFQGRKDIEQMIEKYMKGQVK